MIDTRSRVLLACLLGSIVSGVCHPAPDNFADAKTRDIVGGRKVLIVVPGDAIEPTIQAVPVAPGLVASLITIKANQTLWKYAQQDITPLRGALHDYDFAPRMNAALAPVVQASSWLKPQDVEFSGIGLENYILQKLDESDTRQMLLLYAPYYTDFRFRAIVVELRISLLVRRIPKGKRWEDRLKPKYIPYQQVIRSIVKLPDPDREDRKKNVERWSADQGKLARRALDIGVEEIRRLAARSLEFTAAEAKEWHSRGKRKTVEIDGILGWVRERGEDWVLMVKASDGTWCRIQTLSLQ